MDEYTFSIHPELAGKKIDMRVLRRNAIGEIRDVWKGVLHRLRIVGIIQTLSN